MYVYVSGARNRFSALSAGWKMDSHPTHTMPQEFCVDASILFVRLESKLRNDDDDWSSFINQYGRKRRGRQEHTLTPATHFSFHRALPIVCLSFVDPRVCVNTEIPYTCMRRTDSLAAARLAHSIHLCESTIWLAIAPKTRSLFLELRKCLAPAAAAPQTARFEGCLRAMPSFRPALAVFRPNNHHKISPAL